MMAYRAMFALASIAALVGCAATECGCPTFYSGPVTTCVLPGTPSPAASSSVGVSPIISTPMPSYTSVPATPTPGPLKIAPTSLALSTTGSAGTTGSFAACENLYAGTLTATSENASVATVATESPIAGSSGFTVTSTSSSAGQTLIDVVDAHGNRAALTVNVAPAGISGPNN